MIDELIKISNTLLMTGRRLIGRELPAFERSPLFLKTGTTEGSFQQEGKQDSLIHFLNSLVSTGASSGVHFCKTIAGIPSGPEALEESNPVIILDTSETVKLIQ